MNTQHHILERFNYGYVEQPSGYRWPTMGRIITTSPVLLTVEDPWDDNKPSASCVPDGIYDLVPFKRPNGDDVYLMVNQALDIYAMPADIPAHKKATGRSLCIAGHVANFEEDIMGCFGPGLDRELMMNKKTGRIQDGITRSGEAMKIWLDLLGIGVVGHKLTIRPCAGARLGAP